MSGLRQQTVKVIDSKVERKSLPIVVGQGSAYAVLGPANGAHYRTFNLINLQPSDRTCDLSHSSECVYYVEQGGGAIRGLNDGLVQDLVEGSMIHVGAGDAYRIEAGTDGMRLIGGMVPVDPAFYELVQDEAAE